MLVILDIVDRGGSGRADHWDPETAERELVVLWEAARCPTVSSTGPATSPVSCSPPAPREHGSAVTPDGPRRPERDRAVTGLVVAVVFGPPGHMPEPVGQGHR
jgi:hypothetical protein